MADAASFRSIPELFLHRIEATPDADALYRPENGGWKALTWREVAEHVRAIACGLRASGLESEERCAILSGTRVDWLLADIGILCAAGATTTIYPSNTPEECAYIINDSNTRYVFAESLEQVKKKLLPLRDQMPGLRAVYVFDGSGDGAFVYSVSELETKGKAWDKANAGKYEEIARAVGPQSLATLIYTSGTTGMPKGVEITHDAWVFEGEAIDACKLMSSADRQFLFLPLAHSFAKVLEVAIIRIGVPTAVDGTVEKLVENLGTFQPTWVAAVPRIFEKVYNKVISGAREGSSAKYALFKWSMGVGREVSLLRQKGEEPSGFLALKYKIADATVFPKVRAIFGGKLRFFISGSAPLSREIAEFFHAAGLTILEGYGLTESSAGSFCNVLTGLKFGTVGRPLPGVQIKVAPEDGEILLHGRGIMRGYHNNAEATAAALTEDGWLRTGDIGELDADGYLRITDRKKDLIKTSGGKYVAPQELETRLKLQSTLISQVVVHGDRRNFCTALITLEEVAAKKWAAAHGHGDASYEAISKMPDMKAEIKTAVDALNAGLARYATVKDFAILPADFSIETGELTPSMKVKRKVVETRYKDTLDGFYAGALTDL